MINATSQSQSIGDFRDGDDQPIDLSGLVLSGAHRDVDSIASGAAVGNGELTLGPGPPPSSSSRRTAPRARVCR